MYSFSTSGAPLEPTTLQNGKVDTKVKKRIWAFWAPKTCPDAYFSLFGAWGEKHDFLLFAHFCNVSLFGRKSTFWRPKVAEPPKTLKVSPFAPFSENGIQNKIKSDDNFQTNVYIFSDYQEMDDYFLKAA